MVDEVKTVVLSPESVTKLNYTEMELHSVFTVRKPEYCNAQGTKKYEIIESVQHR